MEGPKIIVSGVTLYPLWRKGSLVILLKASSSSHPPGMMAHALSLELVFTDFILGNAFPRLSGLGMKGSQNPSPCPRKEEQKC